MSLSMTTTDYIVMVAVLTPLAFTMCLLPLLVYSSDVRQARRSRSAVSAGVRPYQIAEEPSAQAEQRFMPELTRPECVPFGRRS
jgi:hypothetical protein